MTKRENLGGDQKKAVIFFMCLKKGQLKEWDERLLKKFDQNMTLQKSTVGERSSYYLDDDTFNSSYGFGRCN